jgi:signal transduction histidine kinase
MKLHKIFFYHIFILLTALFVVLSIVSYYTLRNVELERYKDSLKKSILLMEPMLQKRSIDKEVKNFSKLLKERITIIDKDGFIIAESHYDKNKMENHIARPEVKEAKIKGWGEAIRYSHTLKKSLLYIAKKSDNKNFIRVAVALDTIQKNFLQMWIKFLAIFALFIVIVLAISFYMSKKMDKEISKIIRFLKDVSNKKYYTLRVNFAKEFEIIGDYLNILAKKLKKREEKKDKFTKKLKLISKQRSELLSAISHEFKNPVAIISGYTQTLMEDSQIDEKLREKFLAKIYNASTKITTMIDRLTMAIKFENNDLELKKSRFLICDVIKEAVKLMEDKYKNRVIVTECEDFYVEADKTMIEMALINLLDNALKYSESEVKVVAKSHEIRVVDKGVGIKKDELDKITKKFYRTKSHSWDNSMGLGLFIVDYILKLHNSHLKIDSKLKEGSIFSFRL